MNRAPGASPVSLHRSHEVRLPAPRGETTAWLFERMRRRNGSHVFPDHPDPRGVPADDAALALYCLYELHYRGFDDVDDHHEWDPQLIAIRGELEAAFVDRLLHGLGPSGPHCNARQELLAIAADASGPSLSQFLAAQGSLEHLREFAVHRSAYQLKEADPHTWAIPRLRGRAKAALVEIQYGEYGEGHAPDMHAQLFADTMRALDLDPGYGEYLSRIPGVTLDTVNLSTMFGLHRRWRGALIGHLALFEMTSVAPMGRYAQALARHGLDSGARRFYDAHVVADVEHQRIALDDMVGGLLDDEPELAEQVVFGARALKLVEGAFARHLLDRWSCGASSLLAP